MRSKYKIETRNRVDFVNHDREFNEEMALLFQVEGINANFDCPILEYPQMLKRSPPALLIASLYARDKSWMALLGLAKRYAPQTSVILTTKAPDLDTAVAAMRLGALDVFLRPFNRWRFLTIVRGAINIEGTSTRSAASDELRRFDELTPRERDVMELIVNGYTNKESGQKLGISDRTVEVYRARLMEKVGARNTADLIRIAITRQ